MAGITQSSLNLNAEERRAYGQLFQQADSDGVGVVTGDVAVKFFEKTRLDPTVLGEIWQIGDVENRGFLTPAGFSVVLRLIGHCQAGKSPTSNLATQPGPLPRFDGITLAGQTPAAAPAAPPPSTAAAAPITPQSSGPIRVPPLGPDKVGEYSSLFEKAGARNGMLGGDAAKQVFEKAGLPNEVLGQIWTLSDRDARGALNTTEFVVAMHLLASMRSGTMRALPQTLPQGVFDAASRRAPPASGPVPRQLTGQGPQRAQSPLSRPPQQFGSPIMATQTTGNDWLINLQDKAKFDQIFASLDKSGRGFVTGDQAVTFFSNSGLSEDTLASIWDLSDINSEGQLNRDEFAVAMYLVRQQRAKRDGRDDLPTTLPARLVPPSMRQRTAAPAQHTAPAFDNAAFSTEQPKSAADDLFGLDAMSTDAPAQPATSQTATTASDPFAGDAVIPPSSPRSPRGPLNQATSFKPFIPSSSFGQGLASQNTGGSVQSNQSSSRGLASTAAAGDDLLGDTDPEVSNKFTPETTELANMSNQVGTLRTQMQEVQTKKGVTERDLANSSTQKRELEARLAQFRSQYEQEVKEVKSLEARLAQSKIETQKLGQELAMIEGAHADLQNQHGQVSAALETDQRENAALKEKIRALNTEVSELKPILDKLKSDARQQKGLVAINKKQLATNEAERERLGEEKSTVEREIEGHKAALAEQAQNPPASRQISGPPVASPPVASPAASLASQSTNPFFRSMSPQGSMDRTVSPSNFAQSQGHGQAPGSGVNAFENFFGPSEPQQREPETTPAFDPVQHEETATPSSSTPPASVQPVSGLRTPPPSERAISVNTPLNTEPPPPPESRQITSSALPLRTNHLRSESYSSSVKANPPASRAGFSDNGATPTLATNSANSSVNGDYTAAHEAADGAAGASSERTTEKPSVEGAGTTSTTAPPTLAPTHRAQHSVPGAFPGEVESPTRTVSTAGSVTGEHAKEAAMTRPDFDSAFANSAVHHAPSSSNTFPSTSGAGQSREVGSSGATGSEFPPIHDLDNDDSDSDTDRGFEDDFGATPRHSAPNGSSQRVENSASSRPEAQRVESTASVGSALPPLSAQKSPPPYGSAQASQSGHGTDSSQFPPEFGGLLPAREEPASMSPETVQPPMGHESVASPAASMSSGIANAQSFPISTELKKTLSPTEPAGSGPGHVPAAKDEFDSAFDDLDEAKEADHHDGDAFAIGHNGAAKDEFDFNPTFESPAQATVRGTANSSVQQTPTSIHRGTMGTNNAGGSFSSSGFGAPASSAFGNEAPKGESGSGSHDWDAIFSSLDNPPNLAESANGPVVAGKSPVSMGAAGASTSSPQQTLGADQLQRPTDTLARAISNGTDHDDPILKSLTGMGFARADALSALEKYDYNLDKAADFLTFSTK